MQVVKKGEELPNQKALVLEEAFQRFSEASERLELGYELLLKETDELRAELCQKDLEIKKSARLATLGETAAALAHEIRNPLGAIKLFTSLLKEDLRDRPDSLGLVLEIEKGITTLDNVVSNILSFSREEQINFGPVNIHSLIKEQIELLRTSDSSNEIFKMLLEGNPFISGNEHSLRQVFSNLFLNALQATGEKGVVEVSSADQEEYLLVEIRDNGPGIPVDLIDRIFDPFVTTKNQGTGLGLAIVKRIIKQHQGEITVENDPGATFQLKFRRKLLST